MLNLVGEEEVVGEIMVLTNLGQPQKDEVEEVLYLLLEAVEVVGLVSSTKMEVLAGYGVVIPQEPLVGEEMELTLVLELLEQMEQIEDLVAETVVLEAVAVMVVLEALEALEEFQVAVEAVLEEMMVLEMVDLVAMAVEVK